MKLSRKLQLLEAPIQDDIRSMHQARLGYLPNRVNCHFLKSLSLIVSVERSRSPTEQFLLRQNKLQLAQDVGTAINQILKNEIIKILEENFQLPVIECSFLVPTLIENFSLWMAVKTENIESLEKIEIEQLRRNQQGPSNGDPTAVSS